MLLLVEHCFICKSDPWIRHIGIHLISPYSCMIQNLSMIHSIYFKEKILWYKGTDYTKDEREYVYATMIENLGVREEISYGNKTYLIQVNLVCWLSADILGRKMNFLTFSIWFSLENLLVWSVLRNENVFMGSNFISDISILWINQSIFACSSYVRKMWQRGRSVIEIING